MSFLWFIIIGIVAGYVRSIGGLVVQSAGYLFDRWDYRQSGCGYDRGDRFAMDCVSFQRTEA